MYVGYFSRIAEALHDSRPPGHGRDSARYQQWKLDVERVIDACHASNSRFDGSRFADYVFDGEEA